MSITKREPSEKQRQHSLPVSPGRTKGAANKLTKEAKEIIAAAADKLGGIDRLVEWAQMDVKHETAFWTQVFPKLLPHQSVQNMPVTINRNTYYEPKPDNLNLKTLETVVYEIVEEDE